MSSLTKKQLRDAAPVDSLPYQVVRKGHDRLGLPPVLYGKPADVRLALLADVKELEKRAARIGSPADREQIAWLEGQINVVVQDDATYPLSFDVLVDDYTGVRYQVEVRDRRLAWKASM